MSISPTGGAETQTAVPSLHPNLHSRQHSCVWHASVYMAQFGLSRARLLQAQADLPELCNASDAEAYSGAGQCIPIIINVVLRPLPNPACSRSILDCTIRTLYYEMPSIQAPLTRYNCAVKRLDNEPDVTYWATATSFQMRLI